MAKKNRTRNFCGVLQSVLGATVIYGFLYLIASVYQKGTLPASPKELYKSPLANRPGSSSDQIGSTGPSSKLFAEKINPKANWYNRPESLVVPRDNYLGKRPHVDTLANLTKLVEECRGSYENIEKMPYVYDCLKYLDEGEKEYYY